MKRILVFLIRAYQRTISPLLPGACRYYPTCSEYAAQSIERRGALMGLLMAGRRILSCNRFGRGGYDPVGGQGPEADMFHVKQKRAV